MKTVRTGQIFDETLDFDTIQEIIKNLDDEEFLVLNDDNDQNYIQSMFDGGDEALPYVIEIRLYKNDNEFTHYRKYLKDTELVLKYFDDFYHDKIDTDYDFSTWEDVSDEFDS